LAATSTTAPANVCWSTKGWSFSAMRPEMVCFGSFAGSVTASTGSNAHSTIKRNYFMGHQWEWSRAGIVLY
jgi:hypothetical protein